MSLATVQRWVERARDRRLDRVVWGDRPPIALTVQRTPLAVEDAVLALREELRRFSDLGEYGAQAIHRERRAPDEQPPLSTSAYQLPRRRCAE